ncbi:MAG TPA: pyridoxal 5'-phosphate synthase glutaminase subunit PdxT [Candidatus Altiarchaeales archaeon]|nr:pyridoxal 5'-phosphate synthase glutaminase subunit PdxT [Candidatus Altiarchaeales archaeon]
MYVIGVLALQGDVSEHVSALKNASVEYDINSKVVEVKTKEAFQSLDALVIPGGESTTIGKLIEKYSLAAEIKKLAAKGKPILGTCAGLVLMAKKGNSEVKKTGQKLLGLMSIEVQRNAFGRQRESFEAFLKIKGFDREYLGIFIRAPVVKKVWNNAKVLAKFEDKIVLVRQENLLAAAFHPELNPDLRFYKLFFDLF